MKNLKPVIVIIHGKKEFLKGKPFIKYRNLINRGEVPGERR
jgi:hypothetical protein